MGSGGTPMMGDRPSRHRPSPPSAALSRWRLLRELPAQTTVHDELRDTTGPVTSIALAPRRVALPLMVVTSPEGAREVLGERDGVFDKQSVVHREVRALSGDNLFSVGQEEWRPRRRTLQPLFTKDHVASYAGHMVSAAESYAERWQRSGGQVNLHAEMRRLTLRVLGSTLFGRDLERDSAAITGQVDRTLRYITKRTLHPWRAPDWFPSLPRRRARASHDALRELVERAIDERTDKEDAGRELIDLVLAASDSSTGVSLTREQVVEELLVFLIAGHDTTATTLTTALWLLGRHPEVQTKVAEEARALPGAASFADLPSLEMTGRVAQEAMRLYPPAAAIARRATAETSVCGCRVPRGTDVLVSAWALHRDPALWPDPERFDPSRFTPERVNERDRWAYLPFGGGQRRCVGDHYAFAEIVIGLATLLASVEVRAVSEDLPLTAPFTVTTQDPVLVRVAPRS